MTTHRSRSIHSGLLADLARPRRRLLAGLGIVLALSSALPLAGPQLLRAFIDSAAASRGLGVLLAVAALYVVLGVATQVTSVATTFAATRTAWSATNELRERAARHVLGLDLAFHAQTTPGVLVERIDGDATAITRFFTDVVVRVVAGVLTLAGALVLVTREDWRAGLAMALYSSATLLLIVWLRDRAVPYNTAERAAYADVIGWVEEQLDGAEDLRALGAGDHALDLHERASAKALRAAAGAERATAWLWSVTTGAFAAGGILMLVGGWWLHRSGAITLGTVFLLFAYTQVVRRPLELIAEQLQEVQRAAAGAVRAGLRFDGSARLPAGALPVRFEGVAFAYPDDGREVLAAIDLDVPAGRVVGLVGETGSTKTTLARLALRLVDPTAGRVLLGDADLREADAGELRRRVAIVTQDVQLFDTRACGTT
jgi:ATP-binding cassette subfamily B protein